MDIRGFSEPNRDFVKVNIIFPRNVLKELSKVAGPRKRGPFVVQVVKEELKRRKFLSAIKATHGAWDEQDYPEFKGEKETDLFVRNLREETEQRLNKD